MDKARKKDILVKICCVILSFALWLYISNVQNPIRTTVIKNVEVKILNKDILSQYNLIETPNQSYTVNLTVKGSVNEIYSLKPSQFKLQADISSYALKKGTMKIPVEIKSSPSDISIINPENLWVKMDIDNLEQKSIPIKVNLKGVQNIKNKLQESLISPREVLISGPQKYVKYVKSGVVDVFLNKKLRQVNDMYTVTPVDASGTKVEYVYVKPKQIKVQLAFNQSKSVPIEASIKDTKKKNISIVSIEPKNVIISGQESDLKNVNKIITDQIDISKINSDGVIEVPLKVPSNINIQNNSKAKVKLEFDKFINKTLSLNIAFQNLNNNLNATVNPKNISLTISIKESDLNKLGNVNCYVDLSSLKEGNYDLPIKVNLPNGIKKVSYSPQTVKVTINQKQKAGEVNANKNQ